MGRGEELLTAVIGAECSERQISALHVQGPVGRRTQDEGPHRAGWRHPLAGARICQAKIWVPHRRKAALSPSFTNAALCTNVRS